MSCFGLRSPIACTQLPSPFPQGTACQWRSIRPSQYIRNGVVFCLVEHIVVRLCQNLCWVTSFWQKETLFIYFECCSCTTTWVGSSNRYSKRVLAGDGERARIQLEGHQNGCSTKTSGKLDSAILGHENFIQTRFLYTLFGYKNAYFCGLRPPINKGVHQGWVGTNKCLNWLVF